MGAGRKIKATITFQNSVYTGLLQQWLVARITSEHHVVFVNLNADTAEDHRSCGIASVNYNVAEGAVRQDMGTRHGVLMPLNV